MTKPLVRHPITLTPLSPIHIGSGDDLDWTRAVPDPKRHELMVFDPLSVRLPDAALRALETAAARQGMGAIFELQRVLKANVQHLRTGEIGRIELTTGEHERILQSFGANAQAGQWGAGQVASQIAISRHALTPEGRPYVPGSSLKGALRTAEVAKRDAAGNRAAPPSPRPDQKDPSDRLLGAVDAEGRKRFHASPFARLFVSDLLPAGAWSGLVAEVRNHKRAPVAGPATASISVRVELIPPFVPGALRGDIREHRQRGGTDRGRAFLLLADLLRTTHDFHRRLFDFFAGELQKAERGLPPEWIRAVRELLADEALASAIREGRAALVRLGRFGSAESKTVEWRAVRIPQAARTGGQQFVLHPYTLWLADLGPHRLPLGWALLEVAEEPSNAVRAFCDRFAGASREARGEAEDGERPAPPEAPPAALGPRIVTDRSGPNLSRLGMREDQHDAGKPVFDMLKNLSNQVRSWTADERAVFARLYHEKLRNTLPPHQHAVIAPRLPKPE
ncbi:MAG: RAMP superfamily CRISPR-associated protein [Thermaurantiacus sp.]